MSLMLDEKHLRSLIEHLVDVWLVLRSDLTSKYVSSEIFQVLGYTQDEFVAKDVVELVHQNDRNSTQRRLIELEAKQGSSEKSVIRIQHKEGSWKWIEWVSTNHLGTPGVNAIVAKMRDITDCLHAVETVRHADEDSREVANDAADARDRKDEFLAILAHELRNPLAVISNAAQLLQMPSDEHTVRWASQAISRQSNFLSHILGELLDVSNIRQGKIRLYRETISLAAIIRKAMEAVRPLVEEKMHTFNFNDSPEEITVIGDSARIEQVLIHLLTNAAKFTDVNGNIWISLEKDTTAIVRVKDNGVGIEPELLSRLFEPFVQAKQTLDRSPGGLGLGLTLCRSLVELHGGSISATSAGAGHGSDFVIRLPLATPALPETAAVPESPAKIGTAFRVLVVDDNHDSAFSLAKLLRLSGYQISVAHDGRSAISLAQSEVPHVILLDIGLPEIDGYEVAKRVRRDIRDKSMLLVALTGYGNAEDRQRSHEAGFDNHLVKPVDFEQLSSLLRVHLSSIKE